MDKNKQSGIKIGFDAKRAFYNRSGLGNYSRNLLQAFSEYYPQNTYLLFTPGTRRRIILENEDRYSIISPKGPSSLFGSAWRTFFMTAEIRKQGVELFHGLSQELPFRISSAVRSVVTVHDLIFLRFPGYYKPADISIYRKKAAYACKAADHIVAISEQTKKDIVEFLGTDPRKISVIYQGVNPVFRKRCSSNLFEEVRLKFNLPEHYLMYTGTIEERKNLLGIVKAIHETGIDFPLVVIGRKKEPYYGKIAKYIEANKMKNIFFPERVSDNELVALYRNAECFIYPSFYEGFGIPVVEALVSGTPVITSNTGCFAEAGGPGSIYTDPYNISAIGTSIVQVINSREKRAEMIRSGKEYAENFREDKIAKAYMDLYLKIIS